MFPARDQQKKPWPPTGGKVIVTSTAMATHTNRRCAPCHHDRSAAHMLAGGYSPKPTSSNSNGRRSMACRHRNTSRRNGTPPTVGKRLVEGLRTLRLMPVPPGPRAFGSGWPAYAHDWADLLAQQEADEEQKAADQREANHVRLRPSSIESARMEQAICWPARYLHAFPQLVRTVQAVAVSRSRDRDMEHAARRLKLPGRLVRRWNTEGLDLIARGLRSDRVRLF